ncbi:hypothetical protein ACFUEJ_22530 [Gordonia sp. NPDC057258]|uniref:hypothetical protein n=1 Tax=unclassified Gordonia (in: high G+C Gram-positive bacteria) TaxID=2657482 RepID=UPI003625733B
MMEPELLTSVLTLVAGVGIGAVASGAWAVISDWRSLNRTSATRRRAEQKLAGETRDSASSERLVEELAADPSTHGAIRFKLELPTDGRVRVVVDPGVRDEVLAVMDATTREKLLATLHEAELDIQHQQFDRDHK